MGRKNKRPTVMSRLSIFETATLLQNRFLYNANKCPRFGLRQRAAFANFNDIAGTAFIVLVMYVQLSRTFDEFTVDRVFHKTFNRNDNGFLHFVADYTTLQSTDLISHYAPAFSVSKVFTSATLRRTCFNMCVCCSWPLAVCMRRLNCSRKRLRSSVFSSSTLFSRSSCAFITSPS